VHVTVIIVAVAVVTAKIIDANKLARKIFFFI
jgi:hypothetical protein